MGIVAGRNRRGCACCCGCSVVHATTEVMFPRRDFLPLTRTTNEEFAGCTCPSQLCIVLVRIEVTARQFRFLTSNISARGTCRRSVLIHEPTPQMDNFRIHAHTSGHPKCSITSELRVKTSAPAWDILCDTVSDSIQQCTLIQ